MSSTAVSPGMPGSSSGGIASKHSDVNSRDCIDPSNSTGRGVSVCGGPMRVSRRRAACSRRQAVASARPMLRDDLVGRVIDAPHAARRSRLQSSSSAGTTSGDSAGRSTAWRVSRRSNPQRARAQGRGHLEVTRRSPATRSICASRTRPVASPYGSQWRKATALPRLRRAQLGLSPPTRLRCRFRTGGSSPQHRPLALDRGLP